MMLILSRGDHHLDFLIIARCLPLLKGPVHPALPPATASIVGCRRALLVSLAAMV